MNTSQLLVIALRVQINAFGARVVEHVAGREGNLLRRLPIHHHNSIHQPENGLTGTKLGCGEGGCGACTVMVSHVDGEGALVHRAVNACLAPLYSVEGMHVITAEGIGNPRDGLHPVQQRLSHAHGSQCGFCTPGFVMSVYSLLRTKGAEKPTEEEIEDALGGNLWYVLSAGAM